MTDETLDPRDTPEQAPVEPDPAAPDAREPSAQHSHDAPDVEPAEADPAVPDTEHAGTRTDTPQGGNVISMPRWVPAAIVIALFVGVGLGLVIGLLIGGDEATAAAPPEPTVTTDASSVPDVTTTVTLDPDVLAYGEVTVTGDPLPAMQSGAADTSTGLAIPGLAGIGVDGEDVAFSNDGRAKIILFVAHWCPHCREEVPIVRDWLAGDGLPEDIDLYAVSTFTDPARANFPPPPWFEAEDWPAPVILDDQSSTAARSFGINAVPAWVFVWDDGTVAFRGTGKPDAAGLDAVVTTLQEGPTPPAEGEQG
jgi:thiol-disulfide isomerase/thioredoxin